MNLQLWQSEMDHLTERRSALRYKTNIPILFRTFNALEFYSAKELNHSMDGISLSVDFKLAPGVIVQIKHEKCPDSCPGGKACNSCHSTAWVDSHFNTFEHTVAEVDQMVLAATQLMGTAWERKLADNANPFDEAIEQMWITQWLFYANTVRYASAMTGAHKYTAFTDGWWDLSNNLQEIKDKISSQK